jgi:hypothetical protein
MIKTIVITAVLLLGVILSGCKNEGSDNSEPPSGKGIVAKATHTPRATIEEDTATPTPTENFTDIPSVTPKLITPTDTPSITPSEDLVPTGTVQPNINMPTKCGLSRLQPGMWAFALRPLEIYNKGAYDYLTRTDVEIITTLFPGDRLWIVDYSALYYDCTRNSLMWEVLLEDGRTGFAYEFYNPHERDNITYVSDHIQGYYLGAYPNP